IDDYIKKELKNGAQSGKEIKEAYWKDSTTINPKDHNKSFSAAFDKLLKDKIIYIVGYDGGEGRNQNITYGNLVYGILKTEILEIRQLIRELDTENAKEAYDELIKHFNDKVHFIENENMYKWRSLISEVESRKPTDEEILFYEASIEAGKKLDKIREKDPEDALENSILHYYRAIEEKIDELRPILTQIIAKHEEINVMVVDSPIKSPDYEENRYPVPQTLIGKKYSFDAETPKEVLLNKIDCYEPIRRDADEIKTIFDNVISYINSNPNMKDKLIEDLALGLSKQDESDITLNELVYKATDEFLIYN
ncbi:MAG TPA: hypothetical protein VHO92_02395, partial [Methanobacterium sp.]|nr:hypothetical protein [Methanobacterium sp.]